MGPPGLPSFAKLGVRKTLDMDHFLGGCEGIKYLALLFFQAWDPKPICLLLLLSTCQSFPFSCIIMHYFQDL